MKHGSLFTGIGGFDLAAKKIGWENVFQVEIDDYCQKVLNKNFPNVKRYKDIKEFDGTKYRGTIDVISGGFPCQPFSVAGKRQGEKDNRFLWPEMFRVISEIKPRFVVCENVTGIITMENGEILEGIFSDLENEGYKIESFIIPACAIGAWHRRDRIWIISYSNTNEFNDDLSRFRTSKISQQQTPKIQKLLISSTNCKRRFGRNTKRENAKNVREPSGCKKFWSWDFEPNVGRVANGISSELDENLKYYEEKYNKKAISKAFEFRRKMLYEMWVNREFTETSQKIQNGWGNDIMPEMSHRGAYERWLLGKGIKENKKVRDLWKGILSKPFKETQDLQQELFKRIGEIERNEKVGKNRTNRLKALGNAIVPQIAYEIFKCIDTIHKIN